MRLLAATGDFNALAVGVFACVLAVTLVITRWAAKRTHSAHRVLRRRPRRLRPRQRRRHRGRLPVSASTFLGYAGLMYLYGFDGWVIGLGACLSFLPVLYLLAERMRNAGKFTVADVLAFRLKARPVRVATAINTLLISGIYLVAQLVGAGAVIEALAGISFPVAVLICGVFMVVYVVFGGMLATTWVQIIKAVHADDRGHRRRHRGAGQVQLQPGPAARHRGREPPRRQRDPRPGHVPDLADPRDLDRPDDLHRHRRPAAHPDALLHRAGLQRRAQVGALHDRHHRDVHRDGDDHRLRRAGAARPGRDRGRRQGRQPRRAAAGAVPGRR